MEFYFRNHKESRRFFIRSDKPKSDLPLGLNGREIVDLLFDKIRESSPPLIEIKDL